MGQGNKNGANAPFLIRLATCCSANPFGNGNIFVQQEIVFTITLFIMPHTGRQCQHGE